MRISWFLWKNVTDFWKTACFGSVFFGQTSWSFPGRSSALFRGIQCHPVSESARHANKRFILYKHDASRSKNHTAIQSSIEQKVFFFSFNKIIFNISEKNQEITSRKLLFTYRKLLPFDPSFPQVSVFTPTISEQLKFATFHSLLLNYCLYA